MWSGWKCVTMMVLTFAGSMPAAFIRSFLPIRPAAGATCPPVPASNITYLSLDLIDGDRERDRHVRISQTAGL